MSNKRKFTSPEKTKHQRDSTAIGFAARVAHGGDGADARVVAVLSSKHVLLDFAHLKAYDAFRGVIGDGGEDHHHGGAHHHQRIELSHRGGECWCRHGRPCFGCPHSIHTIAATIAHLFNLKAQL